MSFTAYSIHAVWAAQCLDFGSFDSYARDALSYLLLDAARDGALLGLADGVFAGGIDVGV